MQDTQQMHPEDKRNLILFVIISVMLWAAYDHFVLGPKIEKMKAAQEAAQTTQNTPQSDDLLTGERPRETVISETKRLTIENDEVFGSINLKGGRIDDLRLHHHFKTADKKDHIVILSPTGTAYPKYVEFGWIADDTDIKTPDKNTIWKAYGSSEQRLTAGNSVTLFWNNGQGLTFERVISLDEQFGFQIKQRVINGGSQSITLYPYALITEHGLPEQFENRWIVHEGPIGYIGEELFELSYKKLSKKERKTISADTGWIGISEKYWLTALIPEQEQAMKYSFVYTAPPAPGAKDRYQTDMLGSAQVIEPGKKIEIANHLYAGTKHVETLDVYQEELAVKNFELAVDFGWFYFLTRPFFWLLTNFYEVAGNFGIAIIMLTVILRIAVFPLANTSFRSFAKLRQVSPQMMELRQQYASDKQKLQEELVKLYQREKVNPMAGCLPILIQIPIFFALFKVLSISLEMRHAPFYGWINDLSAPDPTSLFNGFGLIPWDPPGFLMIGIWPCLMLMTMLIQRRLSPPPTDQLQAQIIGIMPYMMTFILAQFAAGLVIYWTFNNLLSVVQQYIIMKSMGVEVHLFKKRPNTKDDETNAEAAKEEAKPVEKKTEPTVQREISAPKPKKKKKK